MANSYGLETKLPGKPVVSSSTKRASGGSSGSAVTSPEKMIHHFGLGGNVVGLSNQKEKG
jgi:hypothetical protein